MNDINDTPSIFTNNQSPDNPPLFTCALKLDKYDYEKKVSHIKILIINRRVKVIRCIYIELI